MKKVIIIAIPVLLLVAGGAVFGLAKMGKINIPGVTPKKPVAKTKGPVKPKVEVAKKEEPPKAVEEPKPAPKPTHKIDPEKGAKKLAKYWNEISPASLVGIVKGWKPAEAARVVAAMDPEKASALLSQLDPKTLEIISREIQKQGSLVPITEG
ncbi:MAG: hypothetical protein JNJ45_03595 [Chthonomonas sp.]|nr:hypothetical protein [Chthonomonas sp.]